jgi:hypothetical protein
MSWFDLPYARRTPGMARLAIFTVIAVVLLAVAVPPASSHWLSRTRANAFMSGVAYDDYSALATTTDYFGGCDKRRSRHAVKCLEILWFNSGGPSAIGQWETCAQRGIVRFRSRRSRKLVFVYQPYICLSDRMPASGETPSAPPPAAQPVTTSNGGDQYRWYWDGPLAEWPTVFN